MDKEQVLFEQMCKLSLELEREKKRHHETKQKLLSAMESKEFYRGMALGLEGVGRDIANDVIELMRKERE
jgi:hypothetical protein